MQRLATAILAILSAMSLGTVLAGDQAAGPAAVAEVRNALTELEVAYNRADAKGLAACWTAGGEFIGPSGQRIEGREQIEKAFQEYLGPRKDTNLEIRVISSRLVSEGVALVDAASEVKPAPAGEAGPSQFAMVMVHRDGRWLIESARETAGRTPSPARHLKDVQWMVGDWVSDASAKDAPSLRSNCDWTVNQAFLIRKFKVEGQNAFLHAGTEVIGWDPHAQRIRSWVFDSSGGFGESMWVHDGDRWLIQYAGTLADGSEVSATHILTTVDADTLTLQSKDRSINGDRQPDAPAITLKRQVAAKAAAPGKPPQRILP